MKLDKKNYTFDKSEIFIIFLLFIFIAVLLFSVGIMIGKKLLENECKIMLEETEKSLKDCLSNEIKDNLELTDKIINKESEKPDIYSNNKAEAKVELKEENIKKIELRINEISDELKNKFSIQVSAFQDEIEAQKLSSKLYSLGYKSVYYIPVQIPSKGIWYRVNIGLFPKKNSAEVFAEMLKKQGIIDSYIIRQL